VAAIDKIAEKHGLKVIYDGAHAFGVQVNGESIFNHGHISVCSLHATKLYHSIEGGLIVTKNPDLLRRLADIRNFGFDGPTTFTELALMVKTLNSMQQWVWLTWNILKQYTATGKQLLSVMMKD
jgi:dTDP-4-amino-4,6-dideoxygalactose transaminase